MAEQQPTRGRRYHDGVQRIRDASGRLIGYQVQIRKAGFPPVSRRFRRLEDAKAWRDRSRQEIEQRLVDPAALGRRYTVGAAIDAYLAHELTRLKSTTRRDREDRLRWWRKRLGAVRLQDLTRAMIRDALGRLHCAGATMNRYQTALSAVLSAAQERDWLTRNPAREVKRQRDAKRRERVITATEWAALMGAATELASRPGATLLTRQLPHYLRLLYATGMRAGEALWLRWEDVDLEDGRAVLRDTKNGTTRVAPLSREAIEALLEQLPFRREAWPWVFVGRGPLAPACRFNREFDSAKALAGIGPDRTGEPLVIHSLRHSFATELADGGADLFELMAATGHKSIAAAQRYIKTQEQQAMRALAKRRQPGQVPPAAPVIPLRGRNKRRG